MATSFDNFDEEIKSLIDRYHKHQLGYQVTVFSEDDFEILCEYYDDIEDLPKALSVIEDGINTYPYSAQLKIKKADLLISMENLDEADRVLEEARILDATHPDYFVLKYELLILKNDDNTQEADFLIRSNLRQMNEDDISYVLENVVDILKDIVIYDQITKYQKCLLTLDPENEVGINDYSIWVKYSDNEQHNIDFLVNFLTENTNNAKGWFELGRCFVHLNLTEKAQEAYEFAIALDENFEKAIFAYSELLVYTKKYDKALEQALHLNVIHNKNGVYMLLLGNVYQKLKRYDEAINQYKKMVHFINTDIKDLIDDADDIGNSIMRLEIQFVYNEWIKCLKSQKKYKDAINLIKTAMYEIPSTSKLGFTEKLADMYAKNEDYNAARQLYLELLTKKNGASLWKKYLDTLFQLKCFDDGFEASETAFQRTKNAVFLTYKDKFRSAQPPSHNA